MCMEELLLKLSAFTVPALALLSSHQIHSDAQFVVGCAAPTRPPSATKVDELIIKKGK